MQIYLEDSWLAYHQVLFIDLSQNEVQSSDKSHIKTNIRNWSNLERSRTDRSIIEVKDPGVHVFFFKSLYY